MLNIYNIGTSQPLGNQGSYAPGSYFNPWRTTDTGTTGMDYLMSLSNVQDGDYGIIGYSTVSNSCILFRYSENGGRSFWYRPNIWNADLGTVDSFESELPSANGWGSILPTGATLTYNGGTDRVSLLAGSSTGAGAIAYLTSPSNRENLDHGFVIMKRLSVTGPSTQIGATFIILDDEVSANGDNVSAWPAQGSTKYVVYDTAIGNGVKSIADWNAEHDIEIYVDFANDMIILYKDYESFPSLAYKTTGTTSPFTKIFGMAAYNLDTRSTVSLQSCYAGYLI